MSSTQRVLLMGAFVLCGGAFGFTNGPPNQACESIRPGIVGHGTVVQTGNGGYILVLPEALTNNISNGGFGYEPNKIYEVLIKNRDESISFKGFFIQVIRSNKTDLNDVEIIGNFLNIAEQGIVGNTAVGQNQYQHRIECNDDANSRASIGQINPNGLEFTSMTMNWRAPSDASGGYMAIRYSIVREQPTFWFDLRTYDTSNFVSLTEDGTVTASTVATPANTSTPESSTTSTSPAARGTPAAPDTLDTEVELRDRDGNMFNQLVLSEPTGCEISLCFTYVSIVRKVDDQDYLSIYMEGETSAWVAVGFSETRNMFSADVLACNRDPTSDRIVAVDTWNMARDNRGNEFDDNQDDISLLAGMFSNGRIRCLLKRTIIGTSVGQDFNLDESFYNIYGVSGGTPFSQGLVTHVGGATPIASTNKFDFGTLSLFSSSATCPSCLVLLLLIASFLPLIVNL